MGILKEIQSDDDWGRKVAENDKWIFYRNSMTEMYEKDLEEYDQNGFTLRGEYKVVLAYRKEDGFRTYLALDKQGRPFADWNGPEQFRLKQMLILADLRESCNIVNIAERRMLE